MENIALLAIMATIIFYAGRLYQYVKDALKTIKFYTECQEIIKKVQELSDKMQEEKNKIINK